MIGSPFPSHPTGRSVFPRTAVRQSSSQSMHRCSRVPEIPAANVDQSLGIQGLVRIFLPSEPSASTARGQVATQAGVDESLQGSKCLTGVGVPIIIGPPPHGLVDLLHEHIGRDRCPPFGEGLNPTTYLTLGRFAGKEVNRGLAGGGTAAFDTLKSDKVKAIGQFGDPGLLPPSFSRQAVPRPWRPDTPATPSSPILSRLSRARKAAPRLAARRFRTPPPRAGGAAGAARGPRPPAQTGGGSGEVKNAVSFSYPSLYLTPLLFMIEAPLGLEIGPRLVGLWATQLSLEGPDIEQATVKLS
jgi:hypothetical protein